jgi:hypothetical protein
MVAVVVDQSNFQIRNDYKIFVFFKQETSTCIKLTNYLWKKFYI